MFNQLSERLSNSLKTLRGIGRLTEKNIQDTLQEVRKALIEADVALAVIQSFLDKVERQAIGQEVIKSIRPGEALIKIVQDSLTEVLGGEHQSLNLQAPAPIVILLVGLQGSGKTTTGAKLAKLLKEKEKLSVLVTSTDVYRPAAIDQLQTLAKQVDVDFFPSQPTEKPTDIAKKALAEAKKKYANVLIIDTAGRLHCDEKLMQEIKAISAITQPTETLLVVDSMAGQDAANIAKTFSQALEITGSILTKTDGDSRGGAALSMRLLTDKPIKFIGTGEKIDAIESFHPERIASRILGMGDIVSLVEDAKSKVDEKQAKRLAKRIKKGKRFDLNDFLEQLKQLKKMGGMQSMLSKLPGAGKLPKATQEMMDDKLFVQMEAMIHSMTPQERHFPAVLNGSRKRRIAAGSGTTIQAVNGLLKRFTQLQKMMKRFKGNKLSKQLSNLRQNLPPELLDQLPDDF